MLELRNKSQVTVYIILGIVIIGVIVALIMFKPFTKETTPEQEQFQPIEAYIKDCISSVFTDAVLISSQQAGYIEVPEYTLPVNPLNPFSNSLEIAPNLNIPYWYYEDPNRVSHESIPKLEEIEEHISKYTKENIDFCFANFSSFSTYRIPGLDEIKVETEIKSERIFMEVTGPIDITYKDAEFTIKRYADVFDIPLGSLYDTAVKIMEKEGEEFFFEERTIDMAVVYPEIPLTGVTFDCSPEPWVLEEVKNSYKDIINTNLDAVRLKSSDKYFSLDISNNDVNSFFSYNQEWPFEIEVEPDKEGFYSHLYMDR